MPILAKISTNNAQNFDDELKNRTLSHQKSPNLSQNIEIFKAKFGH